MPGTVVDPSAPPTNPVTVNPVAGGYVVTTNTMFDVGSLSQQIDSAIASVPQNKRGCFLVNADLKKASLALMIKAGDSVSFVARVQKTYSGALDADASVRVAFLKAGEAIPVPTTLADYFLVFRNVPEGLVRNSRLRSFAKAVGIRYFNLRPFLDGERWWDTTKDASGGR